MLEEVKVHIDNIEQEIKKLNENSFESTPKDWKPKRGEKYWVAHYNLSPTDRKSTRLNSSHSTSSRMPSSA